MNADEAIRRQSNTEKLWAFFQQHPREWIDASDLEFAGRQAWRTRLSELRVRLEKDNLGTIENRIQHPFRLERDEDGEPVRIYIGGPVLSQYRFLPYKPIGRDSTQPTPALPLFDDGPWSR